MTQKILSYWGVRLIIFFSILLSAYYFIHNIIFLSIIILLASLLIESLRVNSSYKTFCLAFNKNTLIYTFSGLSYNLFIFLTLAIITQVLNGIPLFIPAESINFGYIFDICILIFFSALFEELVFRGIIYQALIQRFGKYASTLSLSLIFVFAHLVFNNKTFDFIFIINIFLANIVLSMLYLRTGSLWLPFSFHFFWNLFQAMILGSPVSGFYYGIEILNTEVNTYGILFSNEYIGFEGSILCTLVLLISIPLILRYFEIPPNLKSIFFERAYQESLLSEKLIHKSK